MGDRRALFDIGITGPMAGLVPTMIFLLLGLHWSKVGADPPGHGSVLATRCWCNGWYPLFFDPIPPGP